MSMPHKTSSGSDEWYTPAHIFNALKCEFDIDVAAPQQKTNVPAREFITQDSLQKDWGGAFVWMNPPYSGRKRKGEECGKSKWLRKFIQNGNGVALMTDDTSTEWWHLAAQGCDAVLFTKSRVKFIRPDGTVGGSPSNNTCLFAKGQRAVDALKCANINGLGLTLPLPSMGVWP